MGVRLQSEMTPEEWAERQKDIEKYGACKACSGPLYSNHDGYCSVCNLFREVLKEEANKQ
jgi:hypothetical protein